MNRIWIFVLFIFQISFSQQPSQVVIGEEELAGVNIYSILQDQDQSILIATNEGVYRYNSLDFKVLKSSLVGDLSIFGLIKNKKNQIFCYNLSGQIFIIQSDEVIPYFKIPQELLSNNIYLAFDKDENLMVSCKKLLLIKNKKIAKQIYTYTTGYAACIANDVDNTVYFSENNKLFLWKNNKLLHWGTIAKEYYNMFKPFSLGKGNINFSIATRAQNLIQHKSDFNEVVYIEQEKGEVFHPLISQRKKIVWFASSKNGVYAFKPEGEKLFGGQKLLKNYFISGHLEDNQGNIWLTTFGKGIILIPNLNLEDYSNVANIKDEDLLRITHDDNAIYFGGSNGIVYRLQNDKIQKVKEGLGRVEFLKFDSNTNSFFINGLVFDSKFQQIAAHQYNKYDVIFKNHQYWFTTREGLFLLPNLKSQPIPQDYTYRSYGIVQETDGRFWIASSSGLEMRENNNASFQKINFQSQPVFSTHIIEVNDEVWVPCNSGLLIYKYGKLVRKFTTQNGLLTNKPIKVIKDSNYVYISHHQGLQQYDLKTKHFLNFTKVDGLISNAIIDFDVFNGTVYLITAKGLQKINFSYLSKTKDIPNVKITQLAVNGAVVDINQKSFAYNENTLEFYVSAISHQYRDKLKYNYILEGYENKWHTGYFSSDKILYQKLPPGNYTFKIRAAFETDYGMITSCQFVINEVFWKSKLFLFTLMVLLGLLGYFIYNRRVNYLMQQQQQELEQERFKQELNRSQLKALKSQMNPHFVFNALNSIQDFILLNQKELASDYLGDFADLMRGYLDHSQEDKISLQEEIELLELYLKLEKVRFEDDFVYEVNTAKVLDKSISIPSFLIQPYVENALKHGLLHKKGIKKLIIKFTQHNDKILECEIEDNGIGREASAKIKANSKHKSFASEANKTRLELLNSNSKDKIGAQIIDLIDASNQNSGTLVKLTIPII